MVYYFKAQIDNDVAVDEYVIYMGKDKYENDALILHSNPKNLWFHVDKVSSAHLYLELNDEQQRRPFDKLQIPQQVMDTIGHLTKSNSIKGNKMNNVVIIYTPVGNLISDGSMDIGTVRFANSQMVRRFSIGKKDNIILNRVNKTKYEITTDQFVDKEAKSRIETERLKKEYQRQIENQERELNKQYKLEKQNKSNPYDDLFTTSNVEMSSNLTIQENYEDDFM